MNEIELESFPFNSIIDDREYEVVFLSSNVSSNLTTTISFLLLPIGIWFETIKDILDENTAVHLLNLINENIQKIDENVQKINA